MRQLKQAIKQVTAMLAIAALIFTGTVPAVFAGTEDIPATMTLHMNKDLIRSVYDDGSRIPGYNGEHAEYTFDYNGSVHRAFCGAHTLNTPIPFGGSKSLPVSVVNDPFVRKVLYYGHYGYKAWGGFYDSNLNGAYGAYNNHPPTAAGVAVTALALSDYFNAPGSERTAVKGLPEFLAYINSQPDPPAEYVALRFGNFFGSKYQDLYGMIEAYKAPEPKEGGLTITKKIMRDKTLAENAPELYDMSLAGAVYDVFKSDGTKIGTLTTEAGGKSNSIPINEEGSFYAEEVKPPKGFERNPNRIEFTVIAERNSHGDPVSYPDISLEGFDKPAFDPGKLVIRKTAYDKEGSPTYSYENLDKNISLAGALYRVSYYPTLEGDTSGAPLRSWVFETDKQGKISFDTPWLKEGELFLDDDGVPQMLLGTYKIEEILAPKGLARTEYIPDQYIRQQGDGLFLAVYKPPTDVEYQQNVTIRVEKKDAETKENKPQGHGSLAGAEYEVWYYDNLKGSDVLAGIITTDENGVGELKELKPGLYKVKEKKASAGYLVEKTTHSIEARVQEVNTATFVYPHESFEKPITVSFDKTSLGAHGVSMKLVGAELELINEAGDVIERWITDGKTHIIKGLPVGKYKIHESVTPRGYLGLEKDYEFEVTEKEVIQEHEIFNEPIPELASFAKFETGIKSSLPNEKVKVIDTLTYDKVLKGHPYTIKGQIIDKNDTTKVIAESTKTFTPTENEGKVSLEYIFDASALEGTTMVVMNKLFRDDREGEKQVASHENIEDIDQTITVPKIRTRAFDKIDKNKDVFAHKKTTIVDKVSYTNLLVGHKYKVSGVLMNKNTGKPIFVDGKKVTATKEFTAEKTSGIVELEFTFDARALKGEKVVAFEKMTEDEIPVATHEDITDEEQTVYFPEITTLATDASDNEHDMKAAGKKTIVDKVSYRNVEKGGKYVVSGYLMDKTTGKPVQSNGINITATTEFTAEDENGEVSLEYTFNANGYEGHDFVVFEKMYRKSPYVSEDGKVIKEKPTDTEYMDKLVAEHADINDEGQTIHFPKIGTKAEDVKGGNDLEAKGIQTITDTVSYSNLLIGREYTVSGVLMDKSTGAPLIVNGSEVRASRTFVPTSTNGTVSIDFTFDASALAGKTIVVFEDLYRDKKPVATHTDINDKDQTVYVPKIKTSASDIIDNSKEMLADVEQVLVDKVTYHNLIVGKKYVVSGTLMDKATGKPILVDNKPITSSKEFVAEKSDGIIEVEFKINSKTLAGKTTVVFEKLFRDKKEVAFHEDINDKDQTVTFPEVKTTATFADGTKEAKAKGTLTIVDTVKYHNLIVGKEYTLNGVLMDKSTGKPFLVNGKEVHATRTFVPAKADGVATLEFTFDASEIKGELDLVVFEKLFAANGKLVGKHEDINDEGQTVKIVKKKGYIVPRYGESLKRLKGYLSPIMGDTTSIILVVLNLVASGVLLMWIIYKKRGTNHGIKR